MAIADVNRDQRPDLIVAISGTSSTFDNGSVAVFLGQEDRTFGEVTFNPVGVDPRSLAVGDLNGDGVPDAAVANWTSNDVSVFLAVGDGTLSSVGLLATGPHPTGVAIGDVTGDEHSDLVIANFSSDDVTVFQGVGDGTFGKTRSYPAGLNPSALAIADLNDDQVGDVVVANQASGLVAVLLATGDGTLGQARFFRTGEEPLSLAVGDMNGDQAPDLVVANYISNSVAVLRGVGDGTFGPPSSFSLSDRPIFLLIEDMNQDRFQDVLVFNNFGVIQMLRGSGDGSLVATDSYPVATFGWSIAAGDVNGDQVPDVAFADSDNVGVLFGLGGGTLAKPHQYDAGGALGPLIVEDLNGDQALDIAAASNDAFGNIAVLLGSGDGEFELTGYHEGQDYPLDLGVGDFNGDRILDLAYTAGSPDAIWVLRGMGDGTFGADTSYVAGSNPEELAVADLNGDQALDLIVGADKSVEVLLGAGDGTFDTAQSISAGRQVFLAAGDLNGDEVPDLAVVDLYTEDLAVHFGVGDGTFGSAVSYNLGSGTVPLAVLIADVNGDQVPDIGITDSATASILVLLGKGDGTFGPPVSSSAGVGPNSAVVGDFNGDQVQDVALSNSSSDNVIILPGVGDGTFGPGRIFGVGSYPQELAVGNFNGDQLPDLAVGCTPVTVLLAFRPPVITAPAVLDFPAVTVGDSVSGDVTVSNTGVTRVPITNIVFSSPEMQAGASPPITVGPGASLQLPILLAPRERLENKGEIHLYSIVGPAIPVQTMCDIHPLTVSIRREPPDVRVEVGQEIRVIVTPDPQVHVERGVLHYSIVEIGGEFAVPLNTGPEGLEAIIPSRHVTEDGLEYYVEVENSGVIAMDPPGAPDSTHAVGVRFSSFPLPDASQRFLVGRPIQVVTNFTSIDSGTLYYRRPAEGSYRSVPIDTQQPIPVATIPDSVVGPMGIEYWMEIVRGTDRQTDPPDWIGEWPRTIRITVDGLGEEHDHPGGGIYRMVSVPLDFGHDVTLEDILSDQPAFGPYDPLNWRSFRYAEADSEQRYIELSEDAFPEARRVIPGRAFWLASKQQGRIDTAPIVGTSTPSDDVFLVAVEPGWNQIADPFLSPVAWDSMGVVLREEIFPMSEAVGVLEPPIAWRNQGYEDSGRILNPFDGYWVKSLADTTILLLVPPHAAPPGPLPRTPSTVLERKEGWAISIRGAAAGAVDNTNVAGVSPDARNAWDAQDRSEPPMSPGESISLYFPHAAWGQHPGRYTADMRGAYEPLAGERDIAALIPDGDAWGHAWRFDVAKSLTRAGVDEVRLEFAGVESVPKEALVLLLDKRLATVVDLRSDAHYAFYLGAQPAADTEESARFVLLVGSAEFSDAALGELPGPPVRTVLYPSYPNPFNPATLIRYDIADAGAVTVAIYDVRGALVKILSEGRREPGRYEISWNGEDQVGKRVASGVYFCRLTGVHVSASRKMLMLR